MKDIFERGFFCDEGFVILRKETLLLNPLSFLSNSKLKYKIFPMNHKIQESLGLEDEFDYLTEDIFDLKEIFNNPRTIAYGAKSLSVFEIDSDSDIKALDLDFIVFCDESCHMENFKHKCLDDLEHIDVLEFLYGLTWDLLDFLEGEMYYVQIYDINDIPNIRLASFYENVCRNKIVAKKIFKNIYVDKIQDIFFNKLNISSLKDEDKLNQYRIVLNGMKFEDLDGIVEVDGELYSRDKFVSEYIHNINNKPQKEIFLKNLFYSIII